MTSGNAENRAQRAGRRGRLSWALFDWANQPYFTVVVTFVFAPYFARTVVGDAVAGQEIWGYTQAAAGVLIAVVSPVLGAMADAAGPRKPWIALFQAVLVLACFSLWWAVPDSSPERLALIVTAVAIAAIAAEFSIVFNNSLLPGLTTERRLGRLSGYAWGAGYLGGLAALLFVLFAFSLPEAPLLGLDKDAHQHDRIVGPFAGIWIALFVLPLFLFTPDVPPSGLGRAEATRDGLERLRRTLGHLRGYRNLLRFLVARMIYFDGLSAVFAFGGIYAAGIFGWRTEELGIFGIILTTFAALGAFLGGRLDDRVGSRRTILWSLACLTAATLGVVSIGTTPLGEGLRQDTVLFVFSYTVSVPGEPGLLGTPTEWLFLLFGIAVGIFAGPTQAASRTMVARLAPEGMVAEIYGLYALSGKATAFLAPFVVAWFTGMFDSQRAGVATIVIFLAIGWLLLAGVRERREEAVV